MDRRITGLPPTTTAPNWDSRLNLPSSTGQQILSDLLRIKVLDAFAYSKLISDTSVPRFQTKYLLY